MTRPIRSLLFLSIITILAASVSGESFNYLTPKEIKSRLESVNKTSGVTADVQILAVTPGGREIPVLQLSRGSEAPAILVVANMDGDCPLASQAAVELAELLADPWSGQLNSANWYIVPLGNPDGYARFFAGVKDENFTNDRAVNADKDDGIDEDGPDDLNKDGFITQIRQRHPEGEWVEVESNPLLLRKADPAKGEHGVYRLFPEGIDNDGDGLINEDGPGGVNPGHNFPHDFEHFTSTDGLFAASETESRALLEFCFSHTDIAMVITFGRSNTLKEPPSGGRKAEAGESSYKVPERWANRMGLDTDKEYPIKDLLEMARDYTGYKELTEDQLLQWLGVGAAVNPDKGDLKYWEEISKKYNDFIKEAGLDGKRLDPPGLSSGSLEEWSYYQYGVPTFAVDFWTLPEPKKEEKKDGEGGITLDSLENMTNEQFIELGPEKITEFLKANEAPSMYTAEMVINALKGGMMDTKKMAKFMRKGKKSDEEGGADKEDEALFAYNPDAFVAWKEYDHPTLGKVEIGGRKPYAELLPKADEVDSLIGKQLPFVKNLAGMLPQLKIERAKIEAVSSDVFRVDVWVANDGFLPYPTHQGQRCQRPSPPALSIANNKVNILEGKTRVPLKLLDGSGGVEKISWLIQGSPGGKLDLKLDGYSAGSDSMTLTLSEGETSR